MKIVAIIPARGGSKGVPGKNLRPFLGKPLIVHTIEQARAEPLIDRVVVSTDDDAIAQVASATGAQVIIRPAELATDTAPSEGALRHALAELAAQGYTPDLVVFLQATSPLRGETDLAAAIHRLLQHGANSLFSASRVHGFVWRRQESGLRALTYAPERRPRRQDIGEDLLENGSFYLFEPEVLLRHDNRLGGTVAVYEMDPLCGFQIDQPDDFALLERLAQVISPAHRFRVPPDGELAALRLLVLDFDGVLTDNRVYVAETGQETVVCNRSDGLGLEALKHQGVEIIVLSTEKNRVVEARCAKLGLLCRSGLQEKLAALRRLMQERGLASHEVAYVGNDRNDLECLAHVGLPIAVADAWPEVLRRARWVTERSGGAGAVREVCDRIVRARAAVASAVLQGAAP